MVSREISPTLVMLPSETLSEATVAEPFVVRFSLSKLIVPDADVSDPLLKVKSAI